MPARVPCERSRPNSFARPRLLLARLGLLLLPCLLTSHGFASSVNVMEVRPPADQRSIIGPLAASSLLLDAAAAGDSLVAVGQRGHVLLSADAGKSWTQVEVPVRATLTGVFFLDGRLGWAVGHDQAILRTADGGGSWERVHYLPEDEPPLFDVWFRDAEKGFAVGAYGLFLETADGGTTWNQRPISEDDFHLNRLVPAGGERLYLAAEAGMVYRSDDGGETWEALDSPYEGSFFGALWLGGDEVFLYGLRGHLFRSQDAGGTWDVVETGTEESLTAGVVLTDGRVVLVGLGGTVLVSGDGGHSFRLQQQEDRKGLASVVQAKDGTVVVFGEGGARRIEIAK